MKITNLKWILVLVSLVTAASACSPAPAQTPVTTRVATQTPWIIDRPVTVTPEPATVTPLPTATSAQPTRAPTRAAPKATAKPTATVAPAVPAAPSATSTPACDYGPVTLKEPDPNASRSTKEKGVGGDTFRFIWDPPSSLQAPGDDTVGYEVVITSKHQGGTAGANLYVSNNTFLANNKTLILDKAGVSALAGGVDSSVTWYVNVVKTSGGFNDSDIQARPPGLVQCGAPSETRLIILKTY